MRSALGALLALAFVACGGDGNDEAGSGEPPKLAELEAQIFSKSCVFGSCHAADTAKGGLTLAGGVHSQLVGRPATGAPGRVLVEPGDPERSYLMEKLTSDRPAAGQRMPPNQPLDRALIERVRAWIAAGAKQD